MGGETAEIFWAIFAAYGLLETILGVVYWRRGLRSLEWPQTTGVIRASSIRFKGQSAPIVTYEYKVGGIWYSSKRTSFGTSFGTSSKRNISYRVGCNYPVYYNPDKPKMSVLEPGESVLFNFLTILGLGTFSLGILLMTGALGD